jgi:hypothetical protein
VTVPDGHSSVAGDWIYNDVDSDGNPFDKESKDPDWVNNNFSVALARGYVRQTDEQIEKDEKLRQHAEEMYQLPPDD